MKERRTIRDQKTEERRKIQRKIGGESTEKERGEKRGRKKRGE